jgi:hypothetical protein
MTKKIAPRDPETMDPMGPQNHPLKGTVDFVEGFAFTPPPEDVSAYGARLRRHLSGEADADMLAVVRRIRRKAEIMRLDAPKNTSLAFDLVEIITLADIAAKLAGADDV